MSIRRSLIGAAVVATMAALQGVRAQNCTLAPNASNADAFADSSSIIIHSQNDIDSLYAQLQDCSNIFGGFAIAPDYNGSLTLPSGLGMLTGKGIWQISPPSTPGLTSFNAPDLVILSNLNLSNVPLLSQISMPNIEQIESFSLVTASRVVIDCGSVINIDSLVIEASGPVLNFTSLQQVNEKLFIKAVPGTTEDAPASDLSFESLLNASSISITGHVSSLNMPNLEVAQSYPSSLLSDYGVDIESYGDPLIVNFPLLYDAGGIKLVGNFASLSFPSLVSLNGLFYLDSYLAFSVNFTILEAVYGISLQGEISSFSMPSIKDIQTWVQVNSTVNLDCSIAEEQWKSTNDTLLPGVPASGDARYYSCSGASSKHSVSTGKKVGIAFGVLVVVGVLLFSTGWAAKNWWERKSRATPTIPGGRDIDHELGDIYKATSHVTTTERMGGPPPYTASVHSDIGPLAEPKSAF